MRLGGEDCGLIVGNICAAFLEMRSIMMTYSGVDGLSRG